MTKLFIKMPLSIVALFGFCGAAVAQISSTPGVVSDVYACKSIEEADARLACYDSAVGRLEAAQDSGEIVAISKTEIEEVEKDAFGFNIPSLPKLGSLFGGGDKEEKVVTPDGQEVSVPKNTFEVKNVDEVELVIRKTDTFGYKKVRFFFTNGQVWEQTDSARVRIPRASDDDPNTAVIEKAALGSYLLKVNDSGAAIRVKRVR